MSRADVVARARAFKAREDFPSLVEVGRENGRTPNAHGEDVTAWLIVASAVPFRLAGARGAAATRTITRGEIEAQVATQAGHLPWDFDHLRDGDVLHITQGQNAGRFVKVLESMPADQQSALRVPVYEIDRPKDW